MGSFAIFIATKEEQLCDDRRPAPVDPRYRLEAILGDFLRNL